MENNIDDLLATKSILFSIWRAKYKEFQFDQAEWEEVKSAKIAYDLVEQKYQQARKAAGLVYLEKGE